MTGIDAIAELFAGPGARDYLGEAVSIGEHMRQAGALAEAAGFEAVPHARDAVAVRRWDDEAKDPSVTPPEFAHFAALLESLTGSGTGR